VIFVPFFFLGLVALGILGFVFWIVKLIEIVKIPDHQFQAARTEKLTWVLIVAIAGWIGALIWQFAQREDVLRMAGVSPPPPPGWYPDPGNDGLRWWDGTRWTDHRAAGPPG
jgi:Protein of unknown function (DUF2510)